MVVGLTLTGLRVLVVEDDDLIAGLIEEWLIEQWCEVIGPCCELSTAIEAARTAPIDIALLDVELGAERVYPVAEVLQARGKPFLLLSGRGEDADPAKHPEWQILPKPFRFQDLANMMLEALSCAASNTSRD